METLMEILEFLWARKLFWLAPIVIALVILGALIAFGGGSSILGPFIYAM